MCIVGRVRDHILPDLLDVLIVLVLQQSVVDIPPVLLAIILRLSS